MNILAHIQKMSRIVNQLKKNRTLYLAIGSTIAMFLYAQLILGHFSSCFSISGASNSLGLSFGYDIKKVQHFFEIRTNEQLNCYGHFIGVWDTIFSVIYTLMYSLWFVYLFKKWHLLLIIPFLHMCSDWVENYVELLMIDAYMPPSTLSESLVSLGSGITILKWSLSILTYSIIIYGIITKFKHSKPHKNGLAQNRYSDL